MGYQVYETRHNRYGGYGVPAYCEHPDCNEEIVRDVESYCGGDPHSNEYGCCLSFCDKHIDHHLDENDDWVCDYQQCERCAKGEEPFPLKPEHPEWIEHILNDESWGTWRNNNPDIVKSFKKTC